MPYRLFILGLTFALLPPGAFAQDKPRLKIGIEYAMPGLGKAFGELGVPALKPFAEALMWGKMQKNKDAPLDFTMFDRIVKEYQEVGFTDIYISLCTRCAWGSRSFLKNLVPKEETWPLYEAWVRAIVERYDKDGKDDMPGLRYPLRYYEVGTEFSSYAPEPTKEYLELLERTHRAAKAASKNVVITNAAFLCTTAFRDHPNPAEYETAFAAHAKRFPDKHKTLADIRAVLDRPDLLDAVNFHAVGDAYEIEDHVAWLKYEMARRKYTRPLIISDTTPTPFIAWGNATNLKLPDKLRGFLVQPAIEADRPRLANYFQKLIDKDKAALEWTHSFVAADMVHKCVIAAEQRIELINTSFMEDLFLFQAKVIGGGAGTSAWAGMADVKIAFNEQRTLLGLRPSFYAVQQLQRRLRDYDQLERVKTKDERVRLYKWRQGKTPIWIAWFNSGKLVLPEDNEPRVKISVPTGPGTFRVEPMSISAQRTASEAIRVANSVEVEVTSRPVYVMGL